MENAHRLSAKSIPLGMNAFLHSAEFIRAKRTMSFDPVHFAHSKSGMGQFEGEIAVVCQNQESLRVKIEPPDRIEIGELRWEK